MDEQHNWKLLDKTIIDPYEYELKFSETFKCKNCGRIMKIITSNAKRIPTVTKYEW